MATHLTIKVENILEQIVNVEEKLALIYAETTSKENTKNDDIILQNGLGCLLKVRQLKKEMEQWKEKIVSAEKKFNKKH